MGRRCLLTPHLQAAFCKLISLPMSLEAAAGECSVAPSTIYDWLARGRAGKGRKFIEFSEAVENAQGQGEAAMLAIVVNAATKGGPKGTGDWTAAMTLLERLHWKRYSKRIIKPEDEAKHQQITVVFARPPTDPAAKGDDLAGPTATITKPSNGNGGAK